MHGKWAPLGEFQPTTLARDADGGHIHFDIAHLVRNTVNIFLNKCLMFMNYFSQYGTCEYSNSDFWKYGLEFDVYSTPHNKRAPSNT